MGERQGAHNEIDSLIVDRQLMQVCLSQTGGGHGGSSSVERRLRAVDADDTVAQLGEVTGVPSGAARHIERSADRQLLEDLADDGLLEIDELVAGPVVRFCPRPVPARRGHGGEGHALTPGAAASTNARTSAILAKVKSRSCSPAKARNSAAPSTAN
jgi:hypothetical protein